MKKVIRITESDLTNIIRRVIEEQQGEDKTQQCQKIKNRIAKNTRRGERLLRLFPKPFQSIMKKSFDEGAKNGVQAFFTAIPSEIRDEVKTQFAKFKKPKTDSEIETMVVDAESGKKDIQEQPVINAALTPYVKPKRDWRSYIWLVVLLAIIIFIIYDGNRQFDIGGYCG
jgi:hypothetical protein